VASIPIPGGRSLRPVKNRGKVLIRLLAYQNFPLFFYFSSFSLGKLRLNKTSLYFLLPPIFQSAPLTKKTPPFLFSPVFHWAIYTLNKTFSLEGKSPKWKGKLESEIGGSSAQNWGGFAPDFNSRFGG